MILTEKVDDALIIHHELGSEGYINSKCRISRGRSSIKGKYSYPSHRILLMGTVQKDETSSISAPSPVPTLIQMRHSLAQPIFAAFLAGGVAGAVSRTVVSPLERLKILFQVQSVGREEYKLSVGKGLMKMWKEEGWRGFMRGNGTNCVRIVPYSAVQFGSYNFYKRVSSDTFQCFVSKIFPHDRVLRVYARLSSTSLVLDSRSIKEINADLEGPLVCRSITWGRFISPKASGMWWSRWHYLCSVHIPVGYRTNSTIDPICVFRRTRRGIKKEVTRNVGNHDGNV